MPFRALCIEVVLCILRQNRLVYGTKKKLKARKPARDINLDIISIVFALVKRFSAMTGSRSDLLPV